MIENVVYDGADDGASGRAQHRLDVRALHEDDEHDVVRGRADGADEGVAKEPHRRRRIGLGWESEWRPKRGRSRAYPQAAIVPKNAIRPERQ
jgi:hypothetical protein